MKPVTKVRKMRVSPDGTRSKLRKETSIRLREERRIKAAK